MPNAYSKIEPSGGFLRQGQSKDITVTLKPNHAPADNSSAHVFTVMAALREDAARRVQIGLEEIQGVTQNIWLQLLAANRTHETKVGTAHVLGPDEDSTSPRYVGSSTMSSVEGRVKYGIVVRWGGERFAGSCKQVLCVWTSLL